MDVSAKGEDPLPNHHIQQHHFIWIPITRFGDDIVINGEALGRESWHHQVCWIFLPNNGLLNGLLNGFFHLFL